MLHKTKNYMLMQFNNLLRGKSSLMIIITYKKKDITYINYIKSRNIPFRANQHSHQFNLQFLTKKITIHKNGNNINLRLNL